MSSPLLKMQNVTHVYVTVSEAIKAIENINLSIAAGEFVSLVGPSGCGKTTVLSCLAGILQPTAGHVLLGDKPIKGPCRQVGYMLQADYLFAWRTILDNVLIGLEVMGQLRHETKKHAQFLLNELGLGDYKHVYPSQLSGGMRQRAALVRTLVTNPDILLLDEPFSALDYQTKLKLENLVFETLKKHGKSAVLVTHDIGEAIAMSDRIIVMDKHPGRIKRELIIPDHIRQARPFDAREAEGFYDLFRQIWKELDDDED
ncbi:ABC transporter related protein [Caldalkalibacillus thermarum TA2.A1]|uniref:ABC transporter ATP-binding protein n=1 Tax=Caldalkalibacillus thermarum (strain TA2.A1) TaxID=986075 RepID=F5L8A9_CALTT|nr:ABC transporter ATP-binding protein [Caldalkalibacillus thermarum]EGL82429.1 ABC transporter related protein [Caldalkalibacillus thermarum TA2.A1]QZT35000.1 ABC transporter ATP-binding protein [Caldalkalibacillus thermarum TA2.A1]